MNTLRKKNEDCRRKSWRFWLIFVATPIMVTMCSLLVVYGLYVKGGSSGKRNFEKGLIYANLNRNTEAIAEFKKELIKNPEDADIYYHMGISYFRLREYDNAIAKFEEALKIRPDFSDARLQLTAIYLTEALELRKFGKNESMVLEKILEAEEICRDIIETDPNFINAYTRLGEIHIALGLIDDAIIDYNDALELNSGFVDAHIALIKLYMQRGEFDLAEKHCNVVLSEIDPDSYEAHIFLATIYEQKEEFGKAAECLKQVLEKKPKDMTAHLQLGLLYLKMSRYEEALSEAEQVHKLNPSETPPAVYFIKGNVLLQRKDYVNAIASLKELTKRLPKFALAHYILALALTGNDQIEEAKLEFKTAIDYAPGFVPAQLGLARLLAKDDRHEETIELCKNILEIEPSNVDAMQILGMAYMRIQDFKNAEDLFQRLLEIRPTLGEIDMAHLSLASGQLSKCIRQCEQIAKVNPKEPKVYDILGLAHVRRGDIDKGIEQFLKAIEIAPDSITTHLNLVRAYILKGEKAEAIKTLEKLISFNPNNLHANVILANLYIEKGDIVEATKTLEKVVEINPDYVPGYSLASLYLLQDRADDTIDLCNRALKLAPEDAMLHINLAVAYQQKQNYAASIMACQKAFKLRPEIPFLNILATNIYVASGELVKAKERVESIIEKKQEHKHSTTEVIDVPGLRQIMEEVFNNYYEIAAKLSNNSVENIGNNLDLIIRSSRNVRETDFNIPEDASKKLSEIIKEIEDNANDMKNVELEAARKGFKKLSQSMLKYLKEFHEKIRDSGKACVYYCTVADALWLQDKEGANNPYLGSDMLRCGLMTNIFTANVELVEEKKEVEPISTLTNIQKKEYLELIELFQNNKEKGTQVTLALNKAIVARLKGIFNSAISECERAAKILPENLIPKMVLASTYLLANQKGEAIKIYNEIRNSRPEFTSRDLGMAYLLTDNQDEAISIYQNMIDMDSGSIPEYLILAKLFLKKGSIEEATKMVERVIELDQKNLIAHNLLGEVRLASSSYEDAEKEFLKAIEIKNDTFEGHFNMASIALAKGDIDACIKHCKMGLQTRPTNIYLHNILGMAYMRKGMLDESLVEFNKIIDINSDFVPAHLNLAGIYNSMGKKDEAEAQYRKVIRIDPDNAIAHLNLGIILESKDSIKESIKAYEKVIELKPKSAVAYNNLAWLYISKRKDKLQDALQLAKKAKELAPDNVSVIDTLGWAYFMNGMYDEAMSELETAARNAPLNPTIRYHLGIVYYKKDMWSLALAEIEDALKISNVFPEAKEAKELLEKLSKAEVTEKKIGMLQ